MSPSTSIVNDNDGAALNDRRIVGRATMLGELDSHIENRNMRCNEKTFDLNLFEG